mgnify:CR=1 FL=1
MKYIAILFCVFFFTSCDYFKLQEKEGNTSEIVAIVNTEKLFKKDLLNVLPQNINKQDSLILVKSYIQNGKRNLANMMLTN